MREENGSLLSSLTAEKGREAEQAGGMKHLFKPCACGFCGISSYVYVKKENPVPQESSSVYVCQKVTQLNGRKWKAEKHGKYVYENENDSSDERRRKEKKSRKRKKIYSPYSL